MTQRTLITIPGTYANEFGDPFVEGQPWFVINNNNHKYWYNAQGHLHREDGPAIEWDDGAKFWYFQGKYHRENGPAAECSDGRKEWYFHGLLHREDGPAIEYATGGGWWWFFGIREEARYTKHPKNTELHGRELSIDDPNDLPDIIKTYKRKWIGPLVERINQFNALKAVIKVSHQFETNPARKDKLAILIDFITQMGIE